MSHFIFFLHKCQYFIFFEQLKPSVATVKCSSYHFAYADAAHFLENFDVRRLFVFYLDCNHVSACYFCYWRCRILLFWQVFLQANRCSFLDNIFAKVTKPLLNYYLTKLLFNTSLFNYSISTSCPRLNSSGSIFFMK